MLRTRARLALVLLASCGGQPVGSKVPKVSAGKVAGVAAAAAALTTLADPDHAKRMQESKGGERVEKTHEVHEEVPEDVLSRSEAKSKAKAKTEDGNDNDGNDNDGNDNDENDNDETRPCESSREPVTGDTAQPQDKSKPRIELRPLLGKLEPRPKPCEPAGEEPATSRPADDDQQ